MDNINVINQLNLNTMNTLSQYEIAKQHLSNLGLEDLTSFTPAEKTQFWMKVNAQYSDQFDNLTT